MDMECSVRRVSRRKTVVGKEDGIVACGHDEGVHCGKDRVI